MDPSQIIKLPSQDRTKFADLAGILPESIAMPDLNQEEAVDQEEGLLYTTTSKTITKTISVQSITKTKTTTSINHSSDTDESDFNTWLSKPIVIEEAIQPIVNIIETPKPYSKL